MRKINFCILISSIFFLQCNHTDSMNKNMPFITQNNAALDTATFAGGCFWCMQEAFEELAGVQKVVPDIPAVLSQIRPMNKSVPAKQGIWNPYRLHLIRT